MTTYISRESMRKTAISLELDQMRAALEESLSQVRSMQANFEAHKEKLHALNVVLGKTLHQRVHDLMIYGERADTVSTILEERRPLPPHILCDALNDVVHTDSGVLLRQTTIKRATKDAEVEEQKPEE